MQQKKYKMQQHHVNETQKAQSQNNNHDIQNANLTDINIILQRLEEIVIEDNGSGINLNATFAEPKGNGLANLSRRMENLGGQLQVTSQPEHGVKLKFMVKLEPKLRV